LGGQSINCGFASRLGLGSFDFFRDYSLVSFPGEKIAEISIKWRWEDGFCKHFDHCSTSGYFSPGGRSHDI
jgi:hypothetical protein